MNTASRLSTGTFYFAHIGTSHFAATHSRVKDLIDLTLLIRSDGLSPSRAANALRLVFQRRLTHELPAALAEPPLDWERRFVALAGECQLESDMNGVFRGVAEFFESVMQGGREQS